MIESPIEWRENSVDVLDQLKLPNEEIWVNCGTHEQVGETISNMLIRGAPAIGIAAAYGLALFVKNYVLNKGSRDKFKTAFDEASDYMAKTRPTAVNLFWAIDRIKSVAIGQFDMGIKLNKIAANVVTEAIFIHKDDLARCKQIGEYGARMVSKPTTFLTHCNAGLLATGGYGTALGVIRSCHKKGLLKQVYASETRPYLQGARLTSWELMQDKIPTTLITDNMAGYMFSQGKIDAVVVGADRIAANGDVANKIGTYTLAVLADFHGVPFYVAAPISTFDLECSYGSDIKIEQRSKEELVNIYGKQIAPIDVQVENPAFDVTPNNLVSAIITELGVIDRPNEEKIVEHVKG